MKAVREYNSNNEVVDRYIKMSMQEAKNLKKIQRTTANVLRRFRQIVWDEVIPECNENTARNLLLITDDVTEIIKTLTGSSEV
ncbi:MAG: hypothetical protein IJS99_01470 [Synergistaceae bacterium]|nr:hypothetical protein [Synergistaceae bacterium]